MDYSQFFAVGFRQFLCAAMKQRGKTPQMMAAATGLSRSYIAKLTNTGNEHPSQPSMSNAHLLCQALDYELPKIIYALCKQLPATIELEDKPAKSVNCLRTADPVKVLEDPAVRRDEAVDLINAVTLDKS